MRAASVHEFVAAFHGEFFEGFDTVGDEGGGDDGDFLKALLWQRL